MRYFRLLHGMTLLDFLFAGIKQNSTKQLPKWSNRDEPWTILHDELSGLKAQIIEIIGSEDGCFIHSSAKIGDFVTIESPSFIGPEAVIGHGAFLRGGSWISEGASVGHASEIKNSILLPGSKAPHFNYVGDSILGFDVNIGAGAKLSNFRNDGNVVRLELNDGMRICSNSRKIGSLIGDGSKIGCNVVTNPGTIISPNSMIGPNETITGWYGTKSV